MSSIYRFAKRLELKMKLGQIKMEASDIKSILGIDKDDPTKKINEFVQACQVSDDTNFDVKIKILPNLNVEYVITTTPNNDALNKKLVQYATSKYKAIHMNNLKAQKDTALKILGGTELITDWIRTA
jgi:hypothetical protein